jgi:hypothetical protein
MDEQAVKFVVGLIRRSNAAGVAPPPPEIVAERIDDMAVMGHV